MGNFNRQTHLKNVHEKRKKQTYNKVDKAIKTLIKEHKKINFSSVAKKSNVCKSTLYKRQDIRKRIEKLRAKYDNVNSPNEVKHNIDNNNKDALISSLKRKVKKLKSENNKLKSENNKLEEKIKQGYKSFYENL